MHSIYIAFIIKDDIPIYVASSGCLSRFRLDKLGCDSNIRTLIINQEDGENCIVDKDFRTICKNKVVLYGDLWFVIEKLENEEYSYLGSTFQKKYKKEFWPEAI